MELTRRQTVLTVGWNELWWLYYSLSFRKAWLCQAFFMAVKRTLILYDHATNTEQIP